MEFVHFSNNKLPQDPGCEYAQIDTDGEKWGEGFEIVKCSHPKSGFPLCVSNHQENGCPIDKEIENFSVLPMLIFVA